MVQFKEGDKVRAIGVPSETEYEGTITFAEAARTEAGATHKILVTKIVKAGPGACRAGNVVNVKNVERITEVSTNQNPHPDLIGPAPKPVAGPRFKPPFKAVSDSVQDSTGRRIGYGDVHGEWGDNDAKVAQVIAAALNAFVAGSE